MQSDWIFTVPAMQIAQAHTDAGGTTYSYLLKIEPEGGIGSAHLADVPLLFDTFDTEMGRLLFPHPSDADLAVGAQMRQDWVRFAASGNPGWQEWNEEQTVRVFDADPHDDRYPFADRWEAYDEDPAKALGLLPEL